MDVSIETSMIKASLKIFGRTVSEVKVCSRLNFEILNLIFFSYAKKTSRGLAKLPQSKPQYSCLLCKGMFGTG